MRHKLALGYSGRNVFEIFAQEKIAHCTNSSKEFRTSIEDAVCRYPEYVSLSRRICSRAEDRCGNEVTSWKIAPFPYKQENQTSTDGILPSPFVINEGDKGRMSHQVTLFFSQKFQQIPDCLIRSQHSPIVFFTRVSLCLSPSSWEAVCDWPRLHIPHHPVKEQWSGFIWNHLEHTWNSLSCKFKT